jgi:hypothetical protein
MAYIIIKTANNGYHWAYSSDLTNGSAKYFEKGKGWRKSKAQIVDAPERSSKLTWLEIAKLSDFYGLNVASGYAESKVAGVVAWQTAAGYHYIYQKIKDLIKDEDAWFFDLLRCDYMLACFGMFSFDVVAFDDHLSKLDPEYDSINCTYKGLSDISTGEYILSKYGKRHFEMIQRLLSI